MSADDDRFWKYPRVPTPEAVNATADWLYKLTTISPRPTDSEFREIWDLFARTVAITADLKKRKRRKKGGAAQEKGGTETQAHDREPPLPPDSPPGTRWMLVRPAARKTPPAPLTTSPPSNKRRKCSQLQKNDVAPLQEQEPAAKIRVSSSSSSGLLDLANASEELEENSREKKKGEKFIIDYEIDHLVWVRMSRKNKWIPGQVTAISHSRGGRRTTYDVEFFEKDRHGQYTRAENLAISRLEPVTKDSINRYSTKRKGKQWENAIQELREAYNSSCAEGQRI